MATAGFVQHDTPKPAGEAMHDLIRELYPICRSITGSGTVQTLEHLQSIIPLEIHSIPSGTEVLDWTIPREWNAGEAYVADSRGERVIDFRRHTLHLVNYSAPFRGRVTREELLDHVHSLPERPDAIPYRTSYYEETWGFCTSQRVKDTLRDDYYDVVVDTQLGDGHLHYGELFVPGETPGEILVSTHICHPSLCNDNLSGVAVAVHLAKMLMRNRSRLGYRFLFIPATIGAIAWLATHPKTAQCVQAGVVLACAGDAAPPTYKRSRRGDSVIDRAFALILEHEGHADRIRDFWPYGYDERQYCSPGFNLPVGCLMRSVYGEFPEYHTSDDNLDFVKPGSLEHTAQICMRAFHAVQNNATFLNWYPYCEPQLGKRGLYRSGPGAANENMAMLWVLNQSDGSMDLLGVASRSGLPFDEVHAAADRLEKAGLIQRCSDSSASSWHT